MSTRRMSLRGAMGSLALHVRGPCRPHGLARSASAAHDKGGYAVSQLRPAVLSVSQAVWSAHLKLWDRQRAQPRWFASATSCLFCQPGWLHTPCAGATCHTTAITWGPPEAVAFRSVTCTWCLEDLREVGGSCSCLVGQTEIFFQVVSSPLPAPVPIQRSVTPLQTSCVISGCVVSGCVVSSLVASASCLLGVSDVWDSVLMSLT